MRSTMALYSFRNARYRSGGASVSRSASRYDWLANTCAMASLHGYGGLQGLDGVGVGWATGSDRISRSNAVGSQMVQGLSIGVVAPGLKPFAYSASPTGTQLQNRLRSPYTLSTRPTAGQYFTALRLATGKAPTSRL